MSGFRYNLDKSSKKYLCPSCGKRRFVRYIDGETGELMPEQFGRCDREVNCGYHLNPFTEGLGEGITTPPRLPDRPPVFIPAEILKRTRQCYEANGFVQNLLRRMEFPFEAADVSKVIGLYSLGTVCKGRRTGAIAFPFIDVRGNVRTIQVKTFDDSNHTTATDFLHSMIRDHFEETGKPYPDWLREYLLNERFVSCLFGEHLLSKFPRNPVCLVEAPKTCIIGTLHFGFPDDSPNAPLWLSTYNLSGISYDKCKVLQGRRVTLFPDLSTEGRAFELWAKKAESLNNSMSNARFEVSDILEQSATDEQRERGFDLADFLILSDWRQTRKRNISALETLQPAGKTTKSKEEILAELIAKNPAIGELIERLDCIIYEETSETPANN